MALRRVPDKTRGRITAVWWLFVLAYVLILGRVAYLQTVKVPEFRRLAQQDRQHRKELAAERGRILDRNGKVLACSIQEYTIILHPGLIGNADMAARIIAESLAMGEQQVLSQMHSGRRYIVLAERVPADRASRLRRELLDAPPKAKLNGVEMLTTTRRIYPFGSVGAKLVGAVNGKGFGIAGVEKELDSTLRGKSGWLYADFDSSGRPIPTRMRRAIEPVPGQDVVLSIDSRIQYAAEEALRRQAKTFKAASGSCVVLSPATGEILALAEYPSFDPNHLTPADMKHLPSTSLTHRYEPGSTVKMITAACALQSGLGGVTCRCTGLIPLGGAMLHCPCTVRRRAPGQAVTIQRMLEYSCNTEATTLARKMGPHRLYQGLKAFGILEHYQIQGLGESVGGQVPNPNRFDWSLTRLANVSFGQGVATTRLNLAAAYAALANGGKLMQPILVRQIRRPDCRVVKNFLPRVLGRAVDPATAARLRGYLRTVVEEGTGQNARIDGVDVAGKTGSAQVAGGKRKGFIAGEYVASFCGMTPAANPQLTILVSVENPRGSNHGATVAAPVFKTVAQRALWCVGDVSMGRRWQNRGRHTASGAPRSTGFGGQGIGREG